MLFDCAWDTVNTFSRNDKKLRGSAGAVAVLHTHSRRLDYHPHVHLVMPAAALDAQNNLWRTKCGRGCDKPYLFNHKALAKVFRAKLLAAIGTAGLALPQHLPEKWVVDCKSVGSGEKALVYLGRYLYRGVIQEKDILRCEDGQVSFRYRDGKSGKTCVRTVSGATFLWLVLQHVLPKGFRRARNFGFLHPNSKRLIALLHLVLKIAPRQPPLQAWARPRPTLRCPCCGGAMQIVRRRMAPSTPPAGASAGCHVERGSDAVNHRCPFCANRLSRAWGCARPSNLISGLKIAVAEATMDSMTHASVAMTLWPIGLTTADPSPNPKLGGPAKDICSEPPHLLKPGSSNNRFRSWQARSNLIRYVFTPATTA